LMSDFVPKGFVHVDDLWLQLTLDLPTASRPPQPHPIFEKPNAGEASSWMSRMVPYHHGFAASYDPNEYKSDVKAFKN